MYIYLYPKDNRNHYHPMFNVCVCAHVCWKGRLRLSELRNKGVGTGVGACRGCMWWMGFTRPEDKGCSQWHDMRNMDLSTATGKSIKPHFVCVSVCNVRQRQRAKNSQLKSSQKSSQPQLFIQHQIPDTDDMTLTCRSQMHTCVLVCESLLTYLKWQMGGLHTITLTETQRWCRRHRLAEVTKRWTPKSPGTVQSV